MGIAPTPILAEVVDQEDRVLSQMDSLARELARQDAEIRRLATSQAGLEDSIDYLTAKVDSQSVFVAQLGSQYRILEAERQPLVNLLANSALSELRLGRWQLLEFLLGSSGLDEIFQRRAVLSRVRQTSKDRVRESAERLADIRAVEQEVSAETEQLRGIRTELEQTLARHIMRADELQTSRTEAARQRNSLVNLQSVLEKSESLSDAQTRLQETARGQVATIIGKSTELDDDQSLVSLKGLLPWPAAGSISARFGKKRHQTYETETENPGIDVRTTPGAPVRAVAYGVVSTVSWLRGYGHVCIVVHPGNHHTVYARMAEVTVAQGELVNAGTIVGFAGFDAEQDAYGVHFEIWSGKKKQNPLKWLEPAKN